MIQVSILALENSQMASIADARNVFTTANEFLKQTGQPERFTIELIGKRRKVTLNSGIFTIHPHRLMDDVERTDLIIIPALTGDMMTAVNVNREFAGWISKQYKGGSEVASLCAGAFLLAYSGILNEKQCTTHWLYANEFRYFYPGVELVDEKVITHQSGVYSSGGCNAYWNLLMHLVEKYTDRQMAIRCAKYFVIDLERHYQSPFIIFNGLKDHRDDVIRNVQEFIEKNYFEKLTVDDLADRYNMTRRTFERRFKKATRHTAVEYIQRVKIESTKKQLEMSRKSIMEIMHSVGYADVQTFRDVFRKIAGMSPVDYRNKYLSAQGA